MLKTVSSVANAIGALNYVGTWNASTNTPALASGVGVKGDYYQVSVAGSTTLDGISNWGVGDVVAFNGTTWQRIEGGADLNGVNLSATGTSTLGNIQISGNKAQSTSGLIQLRPVDGALQFGDTALAGDTTGHRFFHMKFNYINGSTDVADIAFSSGGFEVADIEVIATVGGDRGVRKTRVSYQGFSGGTPSQIVAATDVYSGGGAPPSITFTASTSNVRISVGSDATLTGTVTITVLGTRADSFTPLI